MKKLVLLFLSIVCFWNSSHSQITQDILYESPDSQINIYFVSQGFTSASMPSFDAFVNNYLNLMWATQPYTTYQSRFRIIRIQAPSVTESSPGAYFQFDNLTPAQIPPYICVGSNDPQYNQYQSAECVTDFYDRMNTLKAQFTGYNNKSYIIGVFNNNYYTGGGGGEYTFVSRWCDHPYMYKVLLHEFGHSFGVLGDEYPITSSLPYLHDENCQIVYDENNLPLHLSADTYPIFHDRNVTDKNTLSQIPWEYLVPSGLPIPTCDSSVSLPSCSNVTDIGLFEGANYENVGWFRPKNDCLMRTLSQPVYCEVCANLTIERIHEYMCYATNNVTENFVSRHQYITHWRKASNLVTSNSAIGNKISVNYVSGNGITLTSGFHSVVGSDFRAYIGDCNAIAPLMRLANGSKFVESGSSRLLPEEEEIVQNNSIRVYPNPSNSAWNLISTESDITSIQIIDVLGKVVFTQEASSTEIIVDASNFISGVYFAKITTKLGESNIKLIKN